MRVFIALRFFLFRLFFFGAKRETGARAVREVEAFARSLV